jgi:hypothetical protein
MATQMGVPTLGVPGHAIGVLFAALGDDDGGRAIAGSVLAEVRPALEAPGVPDLERLLRGRGEGGLDSNDELLDDDVRGRWARRVLDFVAPGLNAQRIPLLEFLLPVGGESRLYADHGVGDGDGDWGLRGGREDAVGREH